MSKKPTRPPRCVSQFGQDTDREILAQLLNRWHSLPSMTDDARNAAFDAVKDLTTDSAVLSLFTRYASEALERRLAARTRADELMLAYAHVRQSEPEVILVHPDELYPGGKLYANSSNVPFEHEGRFYLPGTLAFHCGETSYRARYANPLIPADEYTLPAMSPDESLLHGTRNCVAYVTRGEGVRWEHNGRSYVTGPQVMFRNDPAIPDVREQQRIAEAAAKAAAKPRPRKKTPCASPVPNPTPNQNPPPSQPNPPLRPILQTSLF